MGIVAIVGGPTASGKTALALRWAEARGLEILSADSRQIYRGFTVGTGAPPPEVLERVPHHLVGWLDPRASFSPKRFRDEVEAVLRARPETGFLLVGGTGLYLKELLYPAQNDRGETPEEIRRAAIREIETKGLAAVHADLSANDPEGMRGVHAHDGYRIQKRLEHRLITGLSYAGFRSGAAIDARFAAVPLLWLNPPRPELHRAIAARVRSMASQGWLEETRVLLRNFDPESAPAFKALGYRDMIATARGEIPLAAALERITVDTRQYAKRQTTFFRNQFPTGLAFRPEALQRALEAADWDGRFLRPDPAVIDKGHPEA